MTEHACAAIQVEGIEAVEMRVETKLAPGSFVASSVLPGILKPFTKTVCAETGEAWTSKRAARVRRTTEVGRMRLKSIDGS